MSAAFAHLEAELRDLDRRLNHDPRDDAVVLKVLARRFEEVLAEINRIPPTDLVDCAIKLHCLADPMHGIETGTLASDLLALRQVAQFLGQVAG
jgi:hypothetical protein